MLLAARGASVVVNDVGCAPDGSGADASIADHVVAEIVAAGGSAVASYDSVCTREGARCIVETACEVFGTVHAVVNNAGFVVDAPFSTMSSQDFDDVIDVHLKGAFHVSQAAFPHMAKNHDGRLVFITSSAGLYGRPNQANYCAAKAGVIGLMKALALEGAEHNVLSNAVGPFAFTRLTESIFKPSVADRFQPDHVSAAVAYLASPTCRTSGTILSVGGGSIGRVFTATTAGWRTTVESDVLLPEHVHANWASINEPDEFTIPHNVDDEVAYLTARHRRPRADVYKAHIKP
jgi:NAD(P)-dependent dehydrogenase (short-subunit alcohol dehydrogenase family)